MFLLRTFSSVLFRCFRISLAVFFLISITTVSVRSASLLRFLLYIRWYSLEMLLLSRLRKEKHIAYNTIQLSTREQNYVRHTGMYRLFMKCSCHIDREIQRYEAMRLSRWTIFKWNYLVTSFVHTCRALIEWAISRLNGRKRKCLTIDWIRMLKLNGFWIFFEFFLDFFLTLTLIYFLKQNLRLSNTLLIDSLLSLSRYVLCERWLINN